MAASNSSKRSRHFEHHHSSSSAFDEDDDDEQTASIGLTKKALTRGDANDRDEILSDEAFEDPYGDDIAVGSSDSDHDSDNDPRANEEAMRQRMLQLGENYDDLSDDAEEDDEEGDEEEGDHASSSSQQQGGEPGPALAPWLGGGEKVPAGRLEHDSTAYDMFHRLNVEWPCMSFDFLGDKLGIQRTKFPHTMFMVAGTSADPAQPHKNRLLVMRFSELHRTKHDDNSSDDESSGDDLADDLDEDPVLDARALRLPCATNRVRAMPQRPNVVAVWGEDSYVRVFNVASQLASLESAPTGGDSAPSAAATPPAAAVKPLLTGRHAAEGYALAWSRRALGRMVAGDCAAGIHLWSPTPSGSWAIEKSAFQGHKGSVEDLAWSPKDDPIFASASVDKTVRLWDSRKKNGQVMLINAHQSDVNVISWNPLSPWLIASGSDDQTFKIWDLRKIKEQQLSSPQAQHKPYAFFNWHKGAITSIDWHPTDKSTLAVASADDTISLWDMNVIAGDAEDMKATSDAGLHIPPQLLFLHHGQEDIKEIHWHPQITSAIASTAVTGINVFKTANI